MDAQDTPMVSNDRSTGRVVMGTLLVAAGSALLIERLGAMPVAWRSSIWPVLLVAYGLARLMQPRAQGREGLFFVLAGGWWLAGASGWISLERTWPVLIVALGVSVMFQSATAGDAAPFGSRGRGRHGAAPWLLLAIFLGAAVSSGLGRHTYVPNASGDGVLRVYSVIGGSNNRVRGTTFTGGEVVSIMGGSQIDLRDAAIPPGQTVTLDVFTLMGGGSILVPDTWLVDFEVMPVLGGVKDRRRLPGADWGDSPSDPAVSSPATGPAPHLVIRGSVIMGGLVVKS